ncbi:Cell Wall Hydrolase [uncultured archaeon]|nr:Cell Wall Hydrolase [uncultured archaeon]
MNSKIISVAIFLFLWEVPKSFGLDVHEQNCLASAIYNEARGEKLEGQYGVGEVILNRMKAGIALSVCSVIGQHRGKHWQFGFKQIGTRKIPPKSRPHFYEIAEKLLSGEHKNYFPATVLYFNNIAFKSKKFHLYRKIGHQRFYFMKNF